MTEDQKLCSAVDRFTAAMKAKLLDKYRECGWTGWDGESFLETNRCLLRLADHVRRLRDGQPQEVDVANFCMFLWNYRTQKENVKAAS